jgi:hypothetical protein
MYLVWQLQNGQGRKLGGLGNIQMLHKSTAFFYKG